MRSDVAGQLARRAVDLAAGEAAPSPLLLRLGHRRGLGEDPECRVVDDSVYPVDVADHVVVQDRLDAPAGFAGVGGHVLAAEEPLLLSRQAGEHDRCGEAPPAEDSRRFDDPCHAAGVVVRSRRVTGGIQGVGDARVDVSGHDDVATRVRLSAKHGQDVHDPGVVRNPTALLAGFEGAPERHLEATATVRRDAIQLRLDPTARGANAACFGLGLGERVTGAEAHQGPDVPLYSLGRDRGHQLGDSGVVARRRAGLRVRGARQSGEGYADDEEGELSHSRTLLSPFSGHLGESRGHGRPRARPS